MSEPRNTGRRARRSGAGSERLAQLKANKARLDAEKAERERLEETALVKIAGLWSRVEEFKQARDEKLQQLQQEAAQLRADTKTQIEAVEAEQNAALVQLHAAGRTADEIAALTELPKDRVRKALREGGRTTKPGRPRTKTDQAAPSPSTAPSSLRVDANPAPSAEEPQAPETPVAVKARVS